MPVATKKPVAKKKMPTTRGRAATTPAPKGRIKSISASKATPIAAKPRTAKKPIAAKPVAKRTARAS